MASTLTLGQPACWPQQLSALSLAYSLDGTLPTNGNVITFVPVGGAPSWLCQIPFTPISGSGTVVISGSDARVPWSQPGFGGQYTWLIVLKAACGAVYAQTTLQIVAPPILQNAVYDGVSVKVDFIPTTLGSPVSFTLSVTSPAGTQTATSSGPRDASIVLALTAPLAGPATFTLTANGTGSNNSAGSSLPLLLTLPVLNFAAYDGATIRAAWAAVQGTTSYLMFASSTGGYIGYQQPTADTQATMFATAINTTYKFAVLASVTPLVWASSVPIPFLLTLPVSTQATYDSITLKANWTAVTDAANYTMQVYSAIGVLAQQNALLANGALPVSIDDMTQSYFFVVMGNATGFVSAAFVAIPLLLTFPVLRGGTYDGTQIRAQWQPVPNASGYEMLAYSPTGAPPFQTNSATPAGTLPAASMSTTEPYLFTVYGIYAGYVWPASVPAPVTTLIPYLSSVLYDQKTIAAAWAKVAGGYVGGYTVRVYGLAGDSYSVSVATQFSSADLELSLPLDAQGFYYLQLTADTPGGISALSQETLLMAAPASSLVSYDGSQVVANWTTPQTTLTITGFSVRVFSADGKSVFLSAVLGPTSTSGAVTVPGGLDPSTAFFAEVVAQSALSSGGTMGCSAAPAALVTELPSIRTAAYDGTTASVSWFPISATTPPTAGYKLTSAATTSGGTTNRSTFPNPMVTEGSVAVATPGGLSYAVQVAAWSGVAQAVSPVLSLVQTAPGITAIAYNGQLVSAAWSSVNGATAYRIQVLQAGGTLAEETVTGTSGTIAATLDPGQACLVSVQALTAAGGIFGTESTGPSATGTILPLTPLGVATAYDNVAKTLTVSWAAPVTPPSALTGFGIAVSSNGTQVASTTAAASATSATLTAVTLNPWQDYTVTVWCTGAATIGPASQPAAVMVGVPQQVLTAYDSSNVTVTWNPVPGAQGYGVVLSTGGTPAVPVYTTSTSLTLPAASGATYAVQVQAVGQAMTGPLSPTTAIFAATPTLTSVNFDGTSIHMIWGAVTGADAYRVTVMSGGSVIAGVTVGATAATLPLPQGSSALSVCVAALVAVTGGGFQQGPSSTPATLLSGIPAISDLKTDPLSGLTTVNWTAPSGSPTGYIVQLYVSGAASGAAVATSDTSYPIPAALTPGSAMSVAVAATGSSGGAAMAGPFSEPAPLPTLQTVPLTVDYDGVNATAAWVSVAGATGYNVYVSATGLTSPLGPFSAPAGATRLVFQPALTDLTKTYSVFVQPTVNGSSGLPSASLPLLQPAFFVSTSPATTYSPYLNPGWTLATSAKVDIVVFLPQIAASGSLQGLPVTNGSFSIAANTQTASSANFPYTLTVPATSPAWTFDTNPLRSTLKADYIALLKALETAGATPAGVLLVQQAISRAMPQTFQETLYYAYGLDVVAGCADLRPGMVLRVAFTDFQNLGTGSPQWQTGFSGAPVVDYDIGSYLSGTASTLLGFDAFIAQLVGNGTLQVTAPSSSPPQTGTSQTAAGVAEAADLFYPAFCSPFYRLFFPATLLSPTGNGSVAPAQNFTIAAAATYTLLANAVNYPTGANALAYFRGRVVLKLCIRVLVNGVEEIVPIGTTVGNLLDRFGWRPPATAMPFGGLQLQRALGPAIFNGSAAYAAGASMPVRLSWNTLPVYGPARDSLSLPLLHGDQISLSL